MSDRDSFRTATPPRTGRPAPSTALAIAILALATSTGGAWSEAPFELTTAFAFNGNLQRGGAPADGSFDFRFELFDSASGGSGLGVLERPGVVVEDGRFDVWLDFGVDTFALDAAFVALAVRPSGEGWPPQPIEPRQRVGGGTCVVNQPVAVAGTVTVDAPAGTADLSTACCNPIANGGQVRIEGFFSDLRLADGQIQAMAFGVPGRLQLNPTGGSVGIGVSAAPAPLSLPGGPDASPAGGGALVVGPISGRNLAFDNNEIIARQDGAPATLDLNFHGSDTRIGGDLDLAIERVSVSSSSSISVLATCPAPKKLISGGCSAAGSGVVAASQRSTSDSSTWACSFQAGSAPYLAYAICGRMKWE